VIHTEPHGVMIVGQWSLTFAPAAEDSANGVTAHTL
jgi:hypothetical protein